MEENAVLIPCRLNRLHSAASDLGLHFLPVSLLWDARLKWVNFVFGSVKIKWRKMQS